MSGQSSVDDYRDSSVDILTVIRIESVNRISSEEQKAAIQQRFKSNQLQDIDFQIQGVILSSSRGQKVNSNK